ncbi:MAG TPA: hypothetical protein ENK18_07305 [Deltaproteobacteria bacterium]|nr:hypothetical protein [Deltaproteobacteria bacterium]
MSEEPLFGEHPTDPSGGTSARVRRFARRFMDRRELAEDTKELLAAVLNSSDKAKTEAVRMVAREVRTYLSELKLKEDLLDLIRSHSLEISISLKPLAPDEPAPAKSHREPREG